ncbi:MAG: Cycloserine biosynthesis protein DcsG [Bacteroidota bacterium]
MKIALLSCQNWAGALASERAFAQEFPPQYDVKVEVWNDPTVKWDTYDYLIFRSIWDYFDFPTAFLAWLDAIERQNIKTLNPIHVVKRNLHKFYLQDLQNQGIDIIPTVFIPKNTGLNLSFLAANHWTKAVIKPAISGGAYATTLFSIAEADKMVADYAAMAVERDLLVQPFMPEIQLMGEISLLFFNGQFSHAVLKKPKEHDFRVQSQFGGAYQIYQPATSMIETAAHIIKKFDTNLLYARVDGILKDGKFLLMEIELIEPDLYFNHFPKAKLAFFKALAALSSYPKGR